ncbi:malonyl-CoA decarboxylase [Lampropedia aestuarii]|uniref:malonyl-CoA decarboxylase n=1 Tax=Lampropedia aestuarii TaxID=2562762 RepID=UPI0024695749|nr:malonyl-CoA decarboxylase [Lampropedia aestuarii]MDH5856746.1 malonyl-CoA decarboxylase [Lampropedia aestuarii]
MAQPSTAPVSPLTTVSRSAGFLRIWRRLMGSLHGREEGSGSEQAFDIKQWDLVDRLLQEAASPIDSETRIRARVRQLLEMYLQATAEDRLQFMDRLAAGFGVDEAVLEDAIESFQEARLPIDKLHAQARIAEALESPRQRILRQFNLLPNGIESLVFMRAELLRAADQERLAPLEHDLLRLLTLWFDAGFLELQRLSWSSPAALLEKLMRYEAVHEIKSWDDLRNRLDSDRRCYAFFHGRMPDEPLIFVEVALVNHLASNVQMLLDESQPTTDPELATTAIFYSISNAQPGLRGVSMGEFLIKRVVAQLAQDFPALETFATLSPVPGFSKWLKESLDEDSYVAQLPLQVRFMMEGDRQESRFDRLQTIVQDQECARSSGLVTKDDLLALEQWLLSECAHYLLQEKSRQDPLDSVARFHFGNGASLQQINWMADTSPKGMRESLGLMVNYLYQLDAIDEQYHAFAKEGRLAHSSEVRKLLTVREALRIKN